jgi:conjugative transfer signal peptidase TraF
MSQTVLTLSLGLASSVLGTIVIVNGLSLKRSLTRGFRVLGFLTAILVLGYGMVAGGLRFNLTPSMPLGIYRLVPVPNSAVARGMVVAVCAPTGASAFGRSRGYLSMGRCPSGTEPLLKAIAGVAGDDVTVSARGVAVDGCMLANSRPFSRDLAGRRLTPWLSGHYRLHRGQLWLYANNQRSWDSRYWGPASVTDVMARAVPILRYRSDIASPRYPVAVRRLLASFACLKWSRRSNDLTANGKTAESGQGYGQHSVRKQSSLRFPVGEMG